MNVALLFRRAVLLLVILSIAAFAASERSGWVLVIGGLLAVAATRITDGPRKRHLPAWAIRFGVFVGIGWGRGAIHGAPFA